MNITLEIENEFIKLETDGYVLYYKKLNELMYQVIVHDVNMVESIEVMLSNEEFIRVFNNPRIAFYI